MHRLPGQLVAASLLLALMHVPLTAVSLTASAAEVTFPAEHLEFFEAKVRPLLSEHCYECHSAQADEVKAGLRLDERTLTLAGGESGAAIVLGKPDESLLIEAVRYESVEMPPNDKLSDHQVAILEKWVELGAPWPSSDIRPIQEAQSQETERDWEQLKNDHWAFRKVVAVDPPDVNDKAWPHSDIDSFVLAKLEAAAMKPSPAADRRTLIRRAFFDLVGLPPTPEEVDAFVNDKEPDAFARLVDRLLETPQYGERWGRHWLDVARYSDGMGGFLDRHGLPHAWRYRDWVVDALNLDMPYDEFLRLQIAGDLIDSPNSTVATGFFAVGPTYVEDGKDAQAKADARLETLDDRVDTLTRGLLGLTVSCARCHDHKFDPIPQLDYYSLAGVFHNTTAGNTSIGPRDTIDRYERAEKVLKKKQSEHKRRDARVRNGNRTPTAEQQKELSRLLAEIEELKNKLPPQPDAVHALSEAGNRDMHLAIRGNPRRLGQLAPRRFLRILAGPEPARFTNGSERIELAEQLVDPANPLTARVFVNRVWMHHMGNALVRTPSNFGTMGEKPTHPELLDWLAARFVAQGWSLKQLHRDIMLTSTYQMSSQFDQAKFDQDGDNRLLWRMNPRRLDVEAWRDSLFAVTGKLDTKMGGPPLDNINRPRRTLYLKASRNGDQVKSDEFLRLFDYPSSRATVAKRTSNIVPQQYLFMMNNPFMMARAKDLVARLQALHKDDDAARIQAAYQLLYGRSATEQETAVGLEYVSGNINGENRWQQYAQVLLSANEFMHVE